MPLYVALVRGINVGGQKSVRMEALRASFENAGLRDVRSYIQSGNVVFSAPQSEASGLGSLIERVVLRDFGYSVTVVVRTAAELREALRSNPFLREKGVEFSQLYLAFLSRSPSAKVRGAFSKLSFAPDRFCCMRREVYLHYPRGAGQTNLGHDTLERKLGVKATMRNWNTVTKLDAMCQEAGS